MTTRGDQTASKDVPAPFRVSALDRPVQPTLLVGWRAGGGLEVHQINVAKEVAAHLQDACRGAIRELERRTARPYSADMHLENDECLVVRDPGLVSSSDLGTAMLHRNWPLLRASELPSQSLWFYAVEIVAPVEVDDKGRETGAEEPIWFVRKANPYKSAKQGRMFTTLHESLTRVEEPLFQLEDRWDVLLGPNGVIALSQSSFEAFFRHAPEAHIPNWIGTVGRHLPLDDEFALLLAERCQTDGRLRSKLRTVASQPYLQNVTIAKLRTYAKQVDVDPNKIIRNGRVFIDPDDRWTLLQILNEDLFRGGLSDTAYLSDRKSPL